MVNIDLLIFDLDGTLIDSKDNIVEAINFTCRQLGVRKKKPDEIVSFIGTGVGDLVKKSLGKENNHLFAEAIVTFKDFFRNHSAEKSKLYPYARDILEYFKNKRMYIVTNEEKGMALSILSSLKISKYFEDIIGADDASCVKPSACPINKIIKPGLDKKRIMIVGDMDLDILSGKEAGILTCAVTHGIGKKRDILKAKPDYIIQSLLELKAVIS